MILTPNPSRRVFGYPAPVDLRKGYDGLFGLVEQGLDRDPMQGDLYLFVNESRKLCKILVWDGSGLCIFQKRLTLGTFAKLWRDDGKAVQLTQRELALFIEGSTYFERRPASAIGEQKRVVSARAT
ncbi:MAG: IS66 family insertion sequence element accessory protein TnpB [Kofleriaceae bacterium]